MRSVQLVVIKREPPPRFAPAYIPRRGEKQNHLSRRWNVGTVRSRTRARDSLARNSATDQSSNERTRGRMTTIRLVSLRRVRRIVANACRYACRSSAFASARKSIKGVKNAKRGGDANVGDRIAGIFLRRGFRPRFSTQGHGKSADKANGR